MRPTAVRLVMRRDRLVVTRALECLSRSPTQFEQLSMVSINLSGQSRADEQFRDLVTGPIAHSDGPPQKVCFWITETATMANLATAKLFIGAL